MLLGPFAAARPAGIISGGGCMAAPVGPCAPAAGSICTPTGMAAGAPPAWIMLTSAYCCGMGGKFSPCGWRPKPTAPVLDR